MPYCKKCGNQLKDGAKFCGSCGQEIRGDGFKKALINQFDKIVNVGNNVSPKQENETPYYNHLQNNQRRESFLGEICKCPNCGEKLDSFVINCPSCGHEIRNTNSTSTVNELAQRLERIEWGQDKKQLIRNFYIPNTKEDILEFFILAMSNIENTEYAKEWHAKLEQAYQKARLSFGNTLEFQQLDEMFKKAQKVKAKQSKSEKRKNALLIFVGAIGFALLIGSLLLGLFIGNKENEFNLFSSGFIGVFILLFVIIEKDSSD